MRVAAGVAACIAGNVWQYCLFAAAEEPASQQSVEHTTPGGALLEIAD
jgi:hypothetical protein